MFEYAVCLIVRTLLMMLKQLPQGQHNISINTANWLAEQCPTLHALHEQCLPADVLSEICRCMPKIVELEHGPN